MRRIRESRNHRAAAVTSPQESRDAGRNGAIRVLAQRITGEREALARRMVECWRQDIVDYRAPSDERVLDEEFAFAVENVDVLVASLESETPVPDAHFDRAREIAARRVHQGVALESFLHAGRLWERVCLEMVLSVARTDVRYEREAALEIARRIADLADRVATACTDAFLDEIADRGLLRHDLLDALLTGKGDDDQTLRLARRLHLRLAANYVVVVLRGDGVALPATRKQPLEARRTLDRLVEEARRHMRPSAGSPLIGMHNGDLIVLFPTAAPADLDIVRQCCEALGAALGAELSMGMSGWHEGRANVAIALVEAMDAVNIAASSGIHGRAIRLDEVLVDSMLHSSVSARRILKETLQPLVRYDASRQAALIDTLRAYVGAHLNVTRSAGTLFVNPNTVVYRLRRIKEVCGRDPHDPDDLLVLSLALKLADLRSSP
jgi:sugar diacid utilization regulator